MTRPQPQPQPQRPLAPAQPMRQAAPQARPMMRPDRPESQPRAIAQEPVRKRGGGWKVVVQFVIGLAVIAGVAAAIVWLYIKYYQQ